MRVLQTYQGRLHDDATLLDEAPAQQTQLPPQPAFSDASVTKLDEAYVYESLASDVALMITSGGETLQEDADNLLSQPTNLDDLNDSLNESLTQQSGHNDDQDYKVGQRLEGRYEVAEVKHGGMGVVYLCYDHQNREPLAIKTFQKKFMDHERAIARFEQEALTWIRLEKHLHIVQARLVQKIDNRPHILLEHVSGMEGVGVDLRSWIDHNRLTPRQALTFALHIALAFLHATTKVPGLVHRDLKPGNILVTHDGIAKVTDFGLVRSLDNTPHHDATEASSSVSDHTSSDEHAQRLTRVDAVVGTPPYMSPEQCLGHPVDPRSDIYAFGIVLYESLTGRHPLEARGPQEWKQAHLHQQPSFDEQACERLPASWRDFVLACLAKDPTARPQTWREVLDSLSALYQAEFGEAPSLALDGMSLKARELMDKGYSLTELGRYEEALLAYDQALELQPDYAWLGRARAAPCACSIAMKTPWPAMTRL